MIGRWPDFESPFCAARLLVNADDGGVDEGIFEIRFLDGAYIPRNYSIDIGLLDLARVEVVKGPQSSLYGQNAFAGAINYVSQKASLPGCRLSGSIPVGTAVICMFFQST